MPIDKNTWWPLDPQHWDQIKIAGSPLAEWINNRRPEAASQTDESWVSKADWNRLQQRDGSSKLVSTSGHLLASIGDASGGEIVAESSFHLLYPWQLLAINEELIGELNEHITLGNLSPAAHVDGILHLGANSKILPGVVIEGNVVIGENCKIGPNCYLRGKTSIGNGVHVGQAVEIKNSIVGDGSAIGHLSYLGDSIVGDNVNFGAGTIVSNFRHDGSNHRTLVAGEFIDTGRRKFGTIIGNGVHTGIQTGIYPGRKLGPNTSTLPGEIIQSDLKN